MIISIIVALGENNVIGRANKIPWRLPDDLKRFKKLTMGKPVVMGRKTYDSIGRPLPGRHNIVITRNREFLADGCTVVHSAEEAIDAAGDANEVMIIGGGRLYEQFLPRADRLYLTLIDESFEGDTFFPELSVDEWHPVEQQRYDAGEDRPYSYTYVVMERRRSSNDTPADSDH